MNRKPTVVVLMATYNGEKYIRSQINSIMNQTYKNIKIIISDDGSTDNTYSIIKDFERKMDGVKVIKNTNHGSARNNFNNLIRYALDNSNEEYYMFSDQDDYWYSDKVSLEMSKMYEMEEQYGKETGNLVYTNYYIVNGANNRKPAYKENIANTPFSRLIMQTWPMGCTMLVNRKLLSDASECPQEVPNHDEWLAIVASIKGKVEYIHNCTMDHILHEKNATTRIDTTIISKRISRTIRRIKEGNQYFKNKMIVSNVLMGMVVHGTEASRMIKAYQELLIASSFKSMVLMRKNNFRTVNVLEDIIFIMAKRKFTSAL